MTPLKTPRVAAGVTTGGQFTTAARTEPTLSLRTPASKTHDAEGFPVVTCGRCKGTGKSEYSRTSGHNQCFNCGGTGFTHEAGPVANAVKALAKARLTAARPRAHQIAAGDLISPVHKEYGRTQWATVAAMHVSLAHPSRTVRTLTGERPTAYHAIIKMTDGSLIRTTTDTVFARRGANVDLTPFHDMAAGKPVDPRLLANPKILPNHL
ncbi:hypothetical protein V5R04_06735 [Jonesiaceae bacterium BS-20]|uniref:Uncharacterized protein n=1 Tax=Jonesiaceae bacterium BS-20 TaxID=3120821 RepID=A0AAU7DYX4_9MICO